MPPGIKECKVLLISGISLSDADCERDLLGQMLNEFPSTTTFDSNYNLKTRQIISLASKL